MNNIVFSLAQSKYTVRDFLFDSGSLYALLLEPVFLGRDTERGGAVDVLAAQLPRSPIDQAIRRGGVANGALVIFVNKKRELM